MVKKMSFLDWCKKYDYFDKYILFQLSLGFSVTQVAELLQVSRTTVYNAIQNNTELIDGYLNSLLNVAGQVRAELENETKREP